MFPVEPQNETAIENTSNQDTNRKLIKRKQRTDRVKTGEKIMEAQNESSNKKKKEKLTEELFVNRWTLRINNPEL